MLVRMRVVGIGGEQSTMSSSMLCSSSRSSVMPVAISQFLVTYTSQSVGSKRKQPSQSLQQVRDLEIKVHKTHKLVDL